MGVERAWSRGVLGVKERFRAGEYYAGGVRRVTQHRVRVHHGTMRQQTAGSSQIRDALSLWSGLKNFVAVHWTCPASLPWPGLSGYWLAFLPDTTGSLSTVT